MAGEDCNPDRPSGHRIRPSVAGRAGRACEVHEKYPRWETIMLQTALCRHLGIRHPVLSAPMGGGMAGPELVTAVSNAGGLGILGMLGLPPPSIREAIRRVRGSTDQPFGANLALQQAQGGEI